jgi:hypothetical protein
MIEHGKEGHIIVVIYCSCCYKLCEWFLLRYMVDAADHDKFDASKNELHNLLDKPQLSGIPVRE